MSWLRRAAGLPPTAAEFATILRDCFAREAARYAMAPCAELDQANIITLAEMRARIALLGHADIAVMASELHASGEIKSQRDAEDKAWILTTAVAAGSPSVTPFIEAILSDRFTRTADVAMVEAILRDRCARGAPAEQLLGDGLAADDEITRSLALHLLATGHCRSWHDVREWAEVTVETLAGEARAPDERVYPIDAAALEAIVRERIARGTPAEQAIATFLDRADGIATLVREPHASRAVWSRRGARDFADRIVASLDDAKPVGEAADIIELLTTANQVARRDAAWAALASGDTL